MTTTLKSLKCGKGLSDLSRELQELDPVVKGQLCLAEVTVRNSSKRTEATFALLPTLHIGDEEYLATSPDPPEFIQLFPDEATNLRIVFDIPSTSSPTQVSFAWEGEDPVRYALP